MSSTSLIRPSRCRPPREDVLDALAAGPALAASSSRSWAKPRMRVQRRAQLVAHAREELALGPVGPVRRPRRAALGDLLLELLVGPVQLERARLTRSSSSSAWRFDALVQARLRDRDRQLRGHLLRDARPARRRTRRGSPPKLTQPISSPPAIIGTTMYTWDAAGEQRVARRARRKRVDLDELQLAPPEASTSPISASGIAHAGPGAAGGAPPRPATPPRRPRGRRCSRSRAAPEQVPQRAHRGLGDRFRRLLGDERRGRSRAGCAAARRCLASASCVLSVADRDRRLVGEASAAARSRPR